MSANLVLIAKKLKELERRLGHVTQRLKAEEAALENLRTALSNAPKGTYDKMWQETQHAVNKLRDEQSLLNAEITEWAARQAAETALQSAAEAGGAAAERGVLWRVASWVGQRVGLGAGGGAIIIITTAGVVVYLGANLVGRLAADRSVAYGEKITGRNAEPGRGLVSGATPPPAETRVHTTFVLTEAKILLRPATTSVPLERFEPALPASIDLTVDEPGYTSVGAIKITAPPTVDGDKSVVKFSAEVNVTFNLKQGADNINAGVNLLGVPGHSALPRESGGWVAPGSHSLTARSDVETDFASNTMVQKWEEDGVLCRRVSIGGHTGVVQRLSGFEVQLTYKQKR